MSCARIVIALVLVCTVAPAEERRVRIRLDDNTVIEATLVDFGSRTYRFRIHGQVQSFSEDRIIEIDFRPEEEAPAEVEPPALKKGDAFEFTDADLRTTLELLARRAGVSIVLGPVVRGTLSAWVPDGDPRAVIEAVAQATGYEVQESSGILGLTPAILKARRFAPPGGGEPMAPMDVKDTDIRRVLTSIAKGAGRGIVLGPTVRGTATLHLEGVPALVALETAAEAVGCGLFVTDAGIMMGVAGMRWPLRGRRGRGV